MKTKLRLLLFLPVAGFAIFFSSCKKEVDQIYDYLVSVDPAVSYSVPNINTLLNEAASLYPEIEQVKSLVKSGVDVYKIVYRADIGSDVINASGLMCVPQDPGTYPVISFQNGTNTVNAWAPSNFVINTQYQMIEIIASMGYVVLLPDYPGFGASASVPHPYLVKEPTVRSVIDMLRAVREASGNEIKNIELKNEFYFIGYSQGGWATMALHSAIEREYSNEFHLAASVCGAGPYDLFYLFSTMMGTPTYPMPVYICYIVNAYKAYNQFTNPVADIINNQYAVKLPQLFDGNHNFTQINAELTTSITELLNPDFLEGFTDDLAYDSVRKALIFNSIQPYCTTKPLYLFHGDSDNDVNPLVTDYFYNQMISAGSSPQVIKKEIFEGLDHSSAAVPSIVKGLIFINEIHSSLN